MSNDNTFTILTVGHMGTKALSIDAHYLGDDGKATTVTINLDQIAFVVKDGKFACDGVLTGHYPELSIAPAFPVKRW